MMRLQLWMTGVALFIAWAAGAAFAADGRQPNILFITADDMSFDSLGVTGCKLSNISPNLDRLAREGLLIDHCHIATPVCGPSRAAFITGTWPQRNGVMGHYNQPPKWFGPSPVKTNLPELLRSQGGYYTGVICKNPAANGWDFEATHLDTGLGRDPAKYEQLTRKFIEAAAARGNKPFFLHANSMDPHEFWAGQDKETRGWIDMMMGGKPYATFPNGKPYPDPQITYAKDQIPVPPCWPDNDAIRKDIYTYFNSVRRLDETVGSILRALDATGQSENTLVVFLSDHGIGREFAKWSLYPLGTRTPMIVRWPGVVQAGRRDGENVISAIDVAPTFLEAAGVAVPAFMDARSILKLIRDEQPREKREPFLVAGRAQDLADRLLVAHLVGDRVLAVRPGVPDVGVTRAVNRPHRAVVVEFSGQVARVGRVLRVLSQEKTLRGSYMGSSVPRQDIPRLIALYLGGQLPIDLLISPPLRLEQINDGFDRLADGAAVRQLVRFDDRTPLA